MPDDISSLISAIASQGGLTADTIGAYAAANPFTPHVDPGPARWSPQFMRNYLGLPGMTGPNTTAQTGNLDVDPSLIPHFDPSQLMAGGADLAGGSTSYTPPDTLGLPSNYTPGVAPGNTPWTDKDTSIAQYIDQKLAPKDASLTKGLGHFIPMALSMISGPLGAALAGPLGISAAAASALVSSIGGGIGGATNGGFGGALEGALAGGLGSLGGHSLSGLFGGGAGGAAGGWGNLDTSFIGDVSGDAFSAAGLGGLLGGDWASAFGGLGSSAGGLGGMFSPTGPLPDSWSNLDTSFLGDPGGLDFTSPPGGPSVGAGAAGGPGRPDANGNTVSEVVVSANPAGSLSPDLGSILGMVPNADHLLHPPDQTFANNDQTDPQQQGNISKFISQLLQQAGGGFGGGGGGPVTSTPPGGGLPGFPGGGPGGGPAPGGSTPPGLSTPASGGLGTPGGGAMPLLNTGPGGGSGAGPGGAGLNLQGSLAPDIYPWSTGGL